MIIDKAIAFLSHRQFLGVATADKNCRPNSAQQFLLKAEKGHVYLVDYVFGRTYHNLCVNPEMAFSVMDAENLVGYRVNGHVTLIQKGPQFKKLVKEFEKKLIRFSADRVVQSVRTGKRSGHFEVEIPDKFVIYKVKCTEAVEIGRQGELAKELV